MRSPYSPPRIRNTPWHETAGSFRAILEPRGVHIRRAAARLPHLIKAHGRWICLQKPTSPTGTVQAVIVFEDKATEHPRDTIRNDVLPGIVKPGER